MRLPTSVIVAFAIGMALAIAGALFKSSLVLGAGGVVALGVLILHVIVLDADSSPGPRLLLAAGLLGGIVAIVLLAQSLPVDPPDAGEATFAGQIVPDTAVDEPRAVTTWLAGACCQVLSCLPFAGALARLGLLRRGLAGTGFALYAGSAGLMLAEAAWNWSTDPAEPDPPPAAPPGEASVMYAVGATVGDPIGAILTTLTMLGALLMVGRSSAGDSPAGLR